MGGLRFGPGQDDAFEAWRDQLVDDFERWLVPFRLRIDPTDLGMLLDWKRMDGDGQVDRWRRTDEEEFLLEWCPRHLSMTAGEAHALPATVTMMMSFLATRDLIGADSDPVERLTEHAIELQADFMSAMDDSSKFGMAKALFANLGLRPDEVSDPAAFQRAIEAFNALPQDERVRLTGTASVPRDAGFDLARLDATIGPVVLPDPDAVRASAEAAPVLAGFDRLVEYLAPPGKVLTRRAT